MLYSIIKHTHMTLVFLSISGFILRFIWKQAYPQLFARKWVKVIPHFVDTLLLLFGIGLTLMVSQYPVTHAWLSAKIIGLILYIILGMMALKRCHSKTGQFISFFSAIFVFAWIVSVALSHQALGFFSPG